MTTVFILFAFAFGLALGAFISQRKAVEAQAKLKALQQHTEETLKLQTDALRAEFKAMSADMVRTQSDTLRQEHLHTLEGLLKPLGRDIESFRNQFLEGNANLDGYIKALAQQTTSLGREAEELARALKGNTKLQGNWGEAVLANLLSASGLTEGRDYTLQSHQKNDEGKTVIPDVVVHLPENRNIIIDSKVSLTAYTAFCATDDTLQQGQLLKDHVASVRKHIKELSQKDYAKHVPGSIGYVLMFIPSESAYVAALNAEPLLSTEAYASHVILINPTNLLMALQLAYNLWQSELQSRSVSEIYSSAEKLYKKFSTFAANFLRIGDNIDKLRGTYDEAQKQLSTGRGNIVSQLEGWKKKGLMPSSSIPEKMLVDTDFEE